MPCFPLVAALTVSLLAPAMARAEDVPGKWTIAAPLLEPGPRGSFDETAVKDPTIVHHGGRWHLFYTARGRDAYALGYVSAPQLAGLATAPRHRLEALRGREDPYAAAPQVLYFEPQQAWYLIFQTRDGSYQPVYAATRTIERPESWSAPRPLVRKQDKAKWIDFWVICDNTTAHLFYTRAHRGVFAMTTSLEAFPGGFRNARKMFSPVHEAVHVYRARARDEFHMLYELRGDGGLRRYGLARAPRLGGPWANVTDHFATGEQLQYHTGEAVWTEEVSHGELLRCGHNQHLEYDPTDTRFLIQGLKSVEHAGPYPDLPWRMGIITKR